LGTDALANIRFVVSREHRVMHDRGVRTVDRDLCSRPAFGNLCSRPIFVGPRWRMCSRPAAPAVGRCLKSLFDNKKKPVAS